MTWIKSVPPEEAPPELKAMYEAVYRLYPANYEAPVAAHMGGPEVAIAVDLGIGAGTAAVWTCDLTHGYIDINASYRN